MPSKDGVLSGVWISLQWLNNWQGSAAFGALACHDAAAKKPD